jgi:hypothetical protein
MAHAIQMIGQIGAGIVDIVDRDGEQIFDILLFRYHSHRLPYMWLK